MNDDDDLLAGVDLHAWQVPPPVAAQRPAILVRALAPAERPRRRIGWLVAGAVALNAAVVAILLVVLRPPAPAPTLPAGGDGRVQLLLAKLRAEQAELERRLAEIKELRATIEQLSEKVRSYEEKTKTVSPPRPTEKPRQGNSALPCDEVSCVLSNYEGPCCQKYRKSDAPPPPTPKDLDRAAISAGIASVRAEVRACGANVTMRETVKLRVRVAPSGLVSSVSTEARTDATLAACVTKAVNGAVFPTTVNGGNFTYPFEFVPSN